MKKQMSVILCLAMLLCGTFCACSSNGGSGSFASETTSVETTKSEIAGNGAADPIEGIEAKASNDKYRNFYEIFTQSFCDSDGDGTGDLKGIISQLDYLNDGDPNSGDDLGVDALWLTPIMPSMSYHKYDVEDYYDIDPSFGTLEIFDELIEECHKRGINVVMDLVLNHISANNPMFQQAVREVSEGKIDGNAEYFEIHKQDYFSADTQVVKLANDYACEANFSQVMPEWNLKSEKTREEFTKIAKFWLDRGVDGFRLDAVRYYNNKETDGVEFLKWFADTCREIKTDAYLVGEDWNDDAEIRSFYESGIDSLFAFKFAQAYGAVVESITMSKGANLIKKFADYEDKMREANSDFINAVFLSNHDQVRIANALQANGEREEKFAANVYTLVPGNSFIYYGEELGMTSPASEGDYNFRLPMVFDSENMPEITVEGFGSDYTVPKDGGVKQQLADSESLLNHYRRIIKIKNQNPEIARGKITEQVSFDDKEVGAYIIEHEGARLLVIHNFNPESEKQLTVTDDILKKAVVRADLVTTDSKTHVELKDGKLTLPAYSSAILKSTE